MGAEQKRIKRLDKKRLQSQRLELARQEQASERRAFAELQRGAAVHQPRFLEMIKRPAFTTPASIDENIQVLCASLSDKEPLYLTTEPQPWSRQSMCNINVQKYCGEHGGRALHGFLIWYNGRDYAEAERHSVWTDGTVIRDVSFSVDGEKTVLFLPDVDSQQHDFDAAKRIYRRGFSTDAIETVAWVVKSFAFLEKRQPRVSDEEGWAKMPTYEQWLAGVRVSNYCERTPSGWVPLPLDR